MSNKLKMLDIGCGKKKVKDCIGIDNVSLPDVDIVMDLEQFPWSFADNEFDIVFANNYLEHSSNILKTLIEIHRITKKNTGRIKVRVPHYSSWNYYGDLTHKTPFSYRSFDHFTKEDETGYNFYSPVHFIINQRIIYFTNPEVNVPNPWKWFGIEYFANRWPKLYERIFAWIFPCTEVYFDITPLEKTW